MNSSFRGICAVDDNIVWASGSRGTVLRTVNGGNDWEYFAISGAERLDFRDVQAFDADNAIVISAGAPAKIFKTINGGLDWKETYSNETQGIFFNSMDFWDMDNGIAVGDPLDGGFMMIRTADGGNTWEQVPKENIPAPIDGEAQFAASGTCLIVQGENNVWFATGGGAARVFRSTDRGDTWTVHETPMISGEASQGIFSLAFRDANTGIIVGGDYRVDSLGTGNCALTTDGGVTWNLVEGENRPNGFKSCVSYLSGYNTNILVAVGTSGTDISRYSGGTWKILGEEGYHTFSFPENGSTGWAAGGNGRIAKLILK
ncbi:WD40/YVTN/BNR-like repeat-containing protein [candidate division KSB1 bacterium]